MSFPFQPTSIIGEEYSTGIGAIGISSVLTDGSTNLIKRDSGALKAFKGLTVMSPTNGGRFMFEASDSYASLNDYDEMATNGTATNTSTTLTTGTSFFESDDAGKRVTILDPATGNTQDNSIAGYTSATQVTLQTAWAYPTVSGTAIITIYDTTNTAIGSVTMLAAGRTLGIIGKGIPHYAGVSLSMLATTTLQFRLFRNGSYLGANTGAYQAGLGQPSAPTVAQGTYGSSAQISDQTFAALGTTLKGLYSVKITRVRSALGTESNASFASASVFIAETGGWLRITFPSASTSNGQDKWGVYVTPAGFGATGSHLFYAEILESDLTTTRTVTDAVTNGTTTLTSATAAFTSTDIGRQIVLTGGTGVLNDTRYIQSINSATSVVINATSAASTGTTAVITQAVDGVTRSIGLQWSDADLIGGDLAPIDNDPPPAGVFACTLGDRNIVIGCQGDQTLGVTASSAGNGYAPSSAGFPENYPPDEYGFLPGPPTAVLERPADGYAFVAGMNWLGALIYRGSGTPVQFQLLWNNTGVNNSSNLTTVDGRLYAVSGKGLVRMGDDGNPEKAWTMRVANDLQGITPANACLGYDADTKIVCLGHSGNIYNYNVAEDKWGAPIVLADLVSVVSGTCLSMVTYQNTLRVSVLVGNNALLYTFDSGSGSLWKAKSAWLDGGTLNIKTITSLQGEVAHDALTAITMKFYKDYSSTADRTLSYTPKATGKQFVTFQKLNVRGARRFQIEATATSAGGESCPIHFITQGVASPVRT